MFRLAGFARLAYSLLMKTIKFCCTLILWSFAIAAAHGAPAWVSDDFEITLRTGPSTSNSIRAMVGSGTRLEVLETTGSDSGYSRVRTSDGTEGWVLSRYLMNQPSAREQLERLAAKLTGNNAQDTSLSSQLAAVRNGYNSAKRQISMLENEKSALESELAEIRRTASDVLGVDQQNKNLMQELAAEKMRADTLQEKNRELSNDRTRYWFLSGAAVLLFGLLLGLWIPRVRWQRRSRYDFQ
jgi:SH3 domain protein